MRYWFFVASLVITAAVYADAPNREDAVAKMQPISSARGLWGVMFRRYPLCATPSSDGSRTSSGVLNTGKSTCRWCSPVLAGTT